VPHLRQALALKRIFRVRHGWYSVPDAPEAGIRAVRVGGRLTGLSALESYGLGVPRAAALHVAVRATASRLRSPADRSARLTRPASVTVHWTDTGAGGSPWRASVADALLVVLTTEGRDVSVAACSAVLRARAITEAALDRVFSAAPARVRRWRTLVSSLDESHGETFARLWLTDAGIPCEQQAVVPGVGRIDFRLGEHLYLEVDGGQHGTPEGWEHDHDRDVALAAAGGRALRVTYRQLLGAWPAVLAAIERALADDAALAARRLRHPYRPRAQPKRRRSAPKLPP
jgi:very-short-patch-repair endonuclease